MRTRASAQAAPGGLAGLLRQHRSDLIPNWRDRVLSDPAVPEANRLAEPALIDHVPELIDRLIDLLDRGIADRRDGEQAGRSAGRGGASRAHATDRLAAHYDLRSAIREVSHLRAAILELCGREGAVIPNEQWQLAHAELDEVMVMAAGQLHEAALGREEALRRAAEQNEVELRRLSDTGMLGVIVSSWDGALIEANDAFLKMVDYQREDLTAGLLDWRELTPAEYRPLDDRALVELVQTGVAAPYEKAYRRRDGSLVHIVIGPAVLDATKRTNVSFLVDITARKAAEAALAEVSQERDATLATLEIFMANAPAGFAVVDRQLRYLRINETLARMNGVPAADHLGRRVAEVLPHFGEQADALARQVLDTRQPITGLHIEVPGRDELGDLLASYYPLGRPNGAVDAVGVVVVDITAQKRAEQELRKDAALRERFMGILGHDLRTPLAAILLSAQALLRNENVPEGFIRSLQRIKNSGRRAERMVNDLLDLVRSRQGGGITIMARPLDLDDLCQDVVAEVNATYPDRKIEVVRHGRCEGRWDADRIAQLATNLLTNAITYSPLDTRVTIELDGRDARSVALRVHNQGDPIPAELMPVLFDPFRRGKWESADQRRGLGLGLHIAQQIARAHGGEISVQSTTEAGTTFTVTLPRG